MWKRMTLILPFMIAVSTVQAGSIERQPFHVYHFRGDVTVSLTVTSLKTSRILDYDFDVTISLTQVDGTGTIEYIDQATHAVHVKCDESGKVLVGGAVYIPFSGVHGNDWKVDLWRSICMSPML